MLTEVLLIALVVALAALVGGLVHLARNGTLSPGQMKVLAAVCAISLLGMLISDWPTGWLSVFWEKHGILGGTISSVLLVGLVFLVWEQADRAQQGALASGLSGAGFGAAVGAVIDLETALALLSRGEEPPAGWDAPDRPLKWMRAHHHLLATDADPRLLPVMLPQPSDDTLSERWRVELIQQVIRRTLAAMRDWGPLIGRSEIGVTALLALSDIRKDCMELAAGLTRVEYDQLALNRLLTTLRQRLRLLAHFFESFSGADPLRPTVLQTLEPLNAIDREFSWSADQSPTRYFDARWESALESTYAAFGHQGNRSHRR